MQQDENMIGEKIGLLSFRGNGSFSSKVILNTFTITKAQSSSFYKFWCKKDKGNTPLFG